MLDPWARAAQQLVRAPGSTEVTYYFKGTSIPRNLRGTFSQPEVEAAGSFGRTGKLSVAVELTICAADVAPGRPEKDDLVGVGSEKGFRVETVRQDDEGVSFILGLRRQDGCA